MEELKELKNCKNNCNELHNNIKLNVKLLKNIIYEKLYINNNCFKNILKIVVFLYKDLIFNILKTELRQLLFYDYVITNEIYFNYSLIYNASKNDFYNILKYIYKYIDNKNLMFLKHLIRCYANNRELKTINLEKNKILSLYIKNICNDEVQIDKYDLSRIKFFILKLKGFKNPLICKEKKIIIYYLFVINDL